MGRVTYRMVRRQKGPGVQAFQLLQVGEDGIELPLTEFATEEEARTAQRALRQLQHAEETARRIGPANEA